MSLPVRVTCDALVERVVIIIGEGAEEYSVGLSAEDAAKMIEQTATACALIVDERRRHARKN